MYVKASTITNLSDARYFAAQYSVEWIGFNLDEGSDTFMPTHVIKAMKEWIEGPKLVGEFGLQSTEEILRLIQDIGLEAVQLPMFSNVSTETIRAEVPVIQEIVIEKEMTAAAFIAQINNFAAKADILLLDFEKAGWTFEMLVRSQEISIEVLQRICQQNTVILNFNANAKQLNTLIQSINPEGISLKGGEEERVGYKSFDELNDVFDTLF